MIILKDAKIFISILSLKKHSQAKNRKKGLFTNQCGKDNLPKVKKNHTNGQFIEKEIQMFHKQMENTQLHE